MNRRRLTRSLHHITWAVCLLSVCDQAYGRAVAEGSDDRSISGILHVESTPSGADVYISQAEGEKGDYSGKTPVEIWLLPFTFWVTVEYPGLVPVQRKLTMRSRDINRLKVTLDYKTNPYKFFGHIAFWPGLAATLAGASAVVPKLRARDRYESSSMAEDRQTMRLWTGVMCAGFGVGGVLMTTGIILWILSPGDPKYFNEKYGISAVADRDRTSVVFSFSRVF